MQFAAGIPSATSFASLLVDPGAIMDPTSLDPFVFSINGMDVSDYVLADSMTITDTIGQPVVAEFALSNPPSSPVVGDTVRIVYYSQVLFGGTIDHVERTSLDLVHFTYRIDCQDWSQVLFRRKIRRNFSNDTVQAIVDSVLDNELSTEQLTIGTIDSRYTLQLVDGRDARIYDVFREIAAATGQTFYVDFDRSIQMRSASVDSSPLVFSAGNVLLQGTTVRTDRETYRNVQIVNIKGTAVSPNTALELTYIVRDESQIAARAAIEGGSGIYEDVANLTHPNSNLQSELALLATGFANTNLAVSGSTRTTIKMRVRGYGFRAGQSATVDLPGFSLTGDFVIQRVNVKIVGKLNLFHELELTTSSLQQRAQEAWLRIVQGANVVVQVSASFSLAIVPTELLTVTTLGSGSWIVPAGITVVEFTAYAPGAGGGGALNGWTHSSGMCFNTNNPTGGAGGAGGKAVTLVNVLEGQRFDLYVGAGGVAGQNGSRTVFSSPPGHTCASETGEWAGGIGEFTAVTFEGGLICRALSGTPGAPAGWTGTSYIAGTDGIGGSGAGTTVTVGGGSAGGARGVVGRQPTAGADGFIEIRW